MAKPFRTHELLDLDAVLPAAGVRLLGHSRRAPKPVSDWHRWHRCKSTALHEISFEAPFGAGSGTFRLQFLMPHPIPKHRWPGWPQTCIGTPRLIGPDGARTRLRHMADWGGLLAFAKKGRAGRESLEANRLLRGLVADLWFDVPVVDVNLYRSQFGEHRSGVVCSAVRLSTKTEAESLAALAWTNGRLTADPLGYAEGAGPLDRSMLDTALSLLPPLPPERKERGGFGDDWLLADDGVCFDHSSSAVWILDEMAKAGLAARRTPTSLGWGCLSSGIDVSERFVRTQSRAMVPDFLDELNWKEKRRKAKRNVDLSVGREVVHMGGHSMSAHEIVEAGLRAQAAAELLGIG